MSPYREERPEGVESVQLAGDMTREARDRAVKAGDIIQVAETEFTKAAGMTGALGYCITTAERTILAGFPTPSGQVAKQPLYYGDFHVIGHQVYEAVK